MSIRSSALRWILFVSLTAATVASALVFSTINTASAANFSGYSGATGCTGGVNRGDSATHDVFYEDLLEYNKSAFGYVRTSSFDPTDVNTERTYTKTSYTDVVVYDNNYTVICGYAWHGSGGSVTGLYVCQALSGGGDCNSSEVRVDTSFTDSASTTNRRSLACHEFGHTLGLLHRSTNSCLVSNQYSIIAIDSHDIGHLNSNY